MHAIFLLIIDESNCLFKNISIIYNIKKQRFLCYYLIKKKTKKKICNR